MYIQRCVKGIAGPKPDGTDSGMTRSEAFDLVATELGILSNWLRRKRYASPPEIARVLNDHNLDRHLHDYDVYGPDTPFISLACGAVERNVALSHNFVHAAIDTALMFATHDWTRPGALFFCWVPTSMNPVTPVQSVAEPVRDINVYQRWSPFQLEGEITAKVNIPANQIERVEWWDGSLDTDRPQDVRINPAFVDPTQLSNIRALF